MIFEKSVGYKHTYAHDIAIIGRTQRAITEKFVGIETETVRIGLAVNEGKIKYMLSPRMDSQHRLLEEKVTKDSYI